MKAPSATGRVTVRAPTMGPALPQPLLGWGVGTAHASTKVIDQANLVGGACCRATLDIHFLLAESRKSDNHFVPGNAGRTDRLRSATGSARASAAGR